jgi:hypothetical protein
MATVIRLGDPTSHGGKSSTAARKKFKAGSIPTVPFHSADSQYTSGKFKGIFRQTGYEHQASYSDENALRSTLYSIVQIARTMTWSK